nr:hypothetical protein [Prevotella sp. P5-92]
MTKGKLLLKHLSDEIRLANSPSSIYNCKYRSVRVIQLFQFFPLSFSSN